MAVLQDKGFAPICLDNYSTSQRLDSAIPQYDLDVGDAALLAKTWKALPPIAGILHFAAFALVGESNQHPGKYFRNNLMATLALAEIAARENIPLIHSSSCAVYGVPNTIPIDEQTPLKPISPYGETKRQSEEILRQFSQTQGLRSLNLRYFNPGGALLGTDHGEAHDPETHLIPNVLRAGLNAKPVSIFGTDHPTPDGTAIRDYLHVEDLALGHIHALEYVRFQPKGFTDAVNLGSGRGYSVLEVIQTAERVLGKGIEQHRQPPRPGDPPKLIASIDKAERLLGWRPTKNLETILRTQLEWEKRRSCAMKSA
jgi:UDP-glucose-4-epimerase GalE